MGSWYQDTTIPTGESITKCHTWSSASLRGIFCGVKLIRTAAFTPAVGKYWLQVIDSNNCVGTDTIQINDANCRSVLLVPSGFTPNGDGLNDLLEPKLLGDVVRFKFSIYDRWGEEVFET
jgi:hypothetical protein